MHRLKRKINKILFSFKKLNNKIFVNFNKKKFRKKVAIISCNKYKNTVKEDILLKIKLNKKYLACDIVSWEDKIDFGNYDALVIRSAWGYQDKIKEFIDWLNYIKKSNILIINDVDTMLLNLNKKEQFTLLKNNNIPTIDTNFLTIDELDNIDNYIKDQKMVIKPIISGSGNNTFAINCDCKNNIKISDIKDTYKNILNDINNYVMLQPFIKEIADGELSIVYLDNKISHAALRYTRVFSNTSLIRILSIDSLDKEAINLANKVNSIKEHKSLYMRVDMIKIDGEYKVLEVELVEPQLFLEFRQTKKQLDEFADIIKRRIN